MKTTAHYVGKLLNGNLSIFLNIGGVASAYVEITIDGEILPTHNLSTLGLKAAKKAIEALGKRALAGK